MDSASILLESKENVWDSTPTGIAMDKSVQIVRCGGRPERRTGPRDSLLYPGLRSLVFVRVSEIDRCRFCVDINSAVLDGRSGSMEKVESLES